jgi:hypothetical protein
MSEIEIARDSDGAAAVARVIELPWLPDRPFWALETTPPELDPTARDQLLGTGLAELDARSTADPAAPGNVCLLLDPAERTRRPALRWDDPPFLFAGYLPDERQVRIAYVGREQLVVPPPAYSGGWLPGDGYRIEPVPGPVPVEKVVEMWLREGVLDRAEAERRTTELLFVATDSAGEPVGAATAYLDFNLQLHALFWYVRAFVATAHRQSNIAFALAMTMRDHLADRFAGGDQRGRGVLWELINPGLRKRWPDGWWVTADFVLVGRHEEADIRVHPFAGAEAPAP